MQVFATGGTGNVGSAVVAELLSHGHRVTVLARSATSAAAAQAAGAAVVRGDLDDLDAVRTGAENSEGVIHLAFGNDFSSPQALAANISEETAAVDTIGQALLGSDRPFVIVSGTPAVAGRASVEIDPLPTDGPVGGRGATVARPLRLADHGVRTAAVRLPRTVHQNGGGGFAGLLAHVARQTGVAGYPGTGTQRWPAVHSLDAAVLFRLVLERADAGTSWHAVADEGDAVRDIAATIGRRLGLEVQQVPAESFGPIGPVFATDQPASSAFTRSELGWTPSQLSLLEDLEQNLTA